MISKNLIRPLFVLNLITLFQYPIETLDNGLALTPPMGWLAWERFTCETNCLEFPRDCINSNLFMSMAVELIENGYLDVGYQYVNIDDCWSEKERDNGTQRLVADFKRFPEGIRGLADHIHSLDLKLGIYGDCGTLTCARYPAQLKTETNYQDNYFNVDAETLNDWRIDSFKFDGCYIDPFKAESICPDMAKALKSHPRPILLVCEWPFYLLREMGTPDWQLAQDSCNVWRYYEDIEDSWISVLNTIDFTVNIQNSIVNHHGPGHWFDPDQLVIGNFALSLDQAKAQMAIWSIWAAPLYMSNDLRSIDPQMAAVLKNRHLIGVNQDKLGVFGLMVDEYEGHNFQAFVKPVEHVKNGCPSFAIVYLNRNTLGNRKKISFKLRNLLKKSAIEVAAERHAQIYNLTKSVEKLDVEQCRRRLETVNSHGNGTLAEHNIVYEVYDLLDGKHLSTISLDSDLVLEVNPSGVRAVKLTEK